MSVATRRAPGAGTAPIAHLSWHHGGRRARCGAPMQGKPAPGGDGALREVRGAGRGGPMWEPWIRFNPEAAPTLTVRLSHDA